MRVPKNVTYYAIKTTSAHGCNFFTVTFHGSYHCGGYIPLRWR